MMPLRQTAGDAALTVLAMVFVLLALALAQTMDDAAEQATPALRDAQHQAAEQAQADRVRRAECRGTHGPTARLVEAPDGREVCARGGPLT